MSRLLTACLLGMVLITAGFAHAAEYRAFTLAETGEQLTFRNVSMIDDAVGFATSWAEQLANVTVYKTEDGGNTWAPIAQFGAVIEPPANGVSSILLSHVFLIRTSYWNSETYQMAGRLWASWDQGATWSELTGLLDSALNADQLGVWTIGATEAGIWVRASRANSEGFKTYMLFSQDQGATWAQYPVPLSKFTYAATKGGYLAGYGTNSEGNSAISRFNQETNQFDIIMGGDLAKADINLLRPNWAGDVFTLVDYQTGNKTSNRMAMYSLDGGMTWSTLFDSDVNDGAHPEQDFFSALVWDAANAYGVWHQWAYDDEGNVVNTGYFIKKTIDAGAAWTTLAQGTTDNLWYQVMTTQEGQAWVAVTLPGFNQYTGGIFNLDQ